MPLTQERLKQIFGAFSYREDALHRGAIIIDKSWVKRNIVHIDTPFGRFLCHRLVAHQLDSFINEAAAAGVVRDVGGVWVPRHVLWDPDKPLSGHAYGCDIDINVAIGKDGPGGLLNYGGNSSQPQVLVDLADAWGFEWGGRWRSHKDGMHFSFLRFIDANGESKSVQCAVHLRVGSSGAQVRKLQRALNAHGALLDVDGIFGPKTKAAVMRWQAQHGLAQTGEVDLSMWRVLPLR